MTNASWHRPEPSLGYGFRDAALLQVALYHGAHGHERLRFLGDALIGYVVARWLFDYATDADEADLAARRLTFTRSRGSAMRAALLPEAAAEALVGAVALDGGEAAAVGLIRTWLPAALPPPAEADPIVCFAEWHQRVHKQAAPSPDYAPEGEPPQQNWTATVHVGGVAVTGHGRRKQDARREACRRALELIDGPG